MGSRPVRGHDRGWRQEHPVVFGERLPEPWWVKALAMAGKPLLWLYIKLRYPRYRGQ